MSHRFSIITSIAALFALLAMTIVAGCGGKGRNPANRAVPAEQLVATFTNPTTPTTELTKAAKDSFDTLGMGTTASPLYGYPTFPFLADLIAIQQKAGNGGDSTAIATLAQIHSARGKDTEAGFISNLNSFLAANYNGANPYLKSLAHLISGSAASAPTYGPSSTFQPYQTYYIVIWSMLQYSPLTRRDEAACALLQRAKDLKDFYSHWPFSWLKPDDFDANIDKQIMDLDKMCHEQ